ncbi:chromosomal replication initiator protein DnaA [Patescibacteria group bacterium]|nr:chromosomal replication initiator protein DnaA [Patescibacteria group bacterium]MBU1868621.1 chromosomal replication initiator protein DnaA [Patescibacteria group bacterium]
MRNSQTEYDLRSQRDLKQIWQSVLGQLELKHSASIINTWFNNTKLEQIDQETAIITCRSPYTKDILQKRYQQTISDYLIKLTQKDLKIKFKIEEQPTKPAKGPLFDQIPSHNSHPSNNISSTTPFPQHNLITRYSFNNFVVGNCNRVAHAAALAVTQQPGNAYNPLFIYGGSGMGKTHLLHAIGNHLVESKLVEKIAYFPVETFLNDFVNAIRFNKTVPFRKKYRENDCLLVDDIQFLGGDKVSTQEEFFHTFNKLYSQTKQIVICSDRPPSEIKQLTTRLVTRFAGGLMVEITPPDFETRLAIIQTKASDLGLELNTETAEFIAQCAGSSIREIEGLILKIRSELLVQDLSPTLGTIKNLLNQNHAPEQVKKRLTPEHIFQLVNEQFGTTMSQLCGRGRKAEIVVPRQIAMYLLRNDLGLNLELIGELIGGRDHTTIMHGSEKISRLLQKKTRPVTEAVRTIRHQLY